MAIILEKEFMFHTEADAFCKAVEKSLKNSKAYANQEIKIERSHDHLFFKTRIIIGSADDPITVISLYDSRFDHDFDTTKAEQDSDVNKVLSTSGDFTMSMPYVEIAKV